MKPTHNFYPRTWLKKFGNLSVVKYPEEDCIRYVIRDDGGVYNDIVIITNKHYKVIDIRWTKVGDELLNKGLLISLGRHQKKGGLIAR